MKAIFNHIKLSVIDLIQNSNNEIIIAVAWFTNQEILGELVKKLEEGVKVSILISDDIINSKLITQSFIEKGGELNIVPSHYTKFLHEKFAVFDKNKIITGSYNFTYNAEYNNFESIIITDNAKLIEQYLVRYNLILKQAKQYNHVELTSNTSQGIIKTENEFQTIEKDLKNELIDTLVECKKLNVKLNYNAIYDLIERYGSIGTPKRLISTGMESIQSGFIKLWEINRLDLTFESIILKDKYKVLFDEKIIEKAKERLNKFK